MVAKYCTALIALALVANLQMRETAGGTDAPRDGVTCFSPKDCRPDECCLSNNRPIGKRSIIKTRRAFSQGVCQKLGTDGSSCIVPLSGIIPDPRKDVIAMDTCPCATEFNCVAGPDALIVIPQGKLGSCIRKTKG